MFAKPVGSANPMKDHEVGQPPEDSISKLVFSPNSNYLVASAWDSTVSMSNCVLSLGRYEGFLSSVKEKQNF